LCLIAQPRAMTALCANRCSLCCRNAQLELHNWVVVADRFMPPPCLQELLKANNSCFAPYIAAAEEEALSRPGGWLLPEAPADLIQATPPPPLPYVSAVPVWAGGAPPPPDTRTLATRGGRKLRPGAIAGIAGKCPCRAQKSIKAAGRCPFGAQQSRRLGIACERIGAGTERCIYAQSSIS
jgi:hypothetical protein